MFNRFIPFAKVDAARREVWGIATEDAPDRDGEICDYATTKPLYEAWSAAFDRVTDGKSLGNVRAMHGSVAAGKLIAINFDDAAKRIEVGAKIVDDAEWRKVEEGVYTGFSQGGVYVKRWKDGAFVRYTAEPVEVSIVDLPCLPSATFTYVKADGSTELRKFREVEMAKEAKTKRVDGEDLEDSAFAYVGDPEKPDTWKLPIKFSDEEKTKSHIRNALARFDQTEGIPDGEKARVKAKIVAAAKDHGIEVGDEAGKASGAEVRKCLCTVAELAYVVDQLNWIAESALAEAAWEGDNSPIGEQLKAAVGLVGKILQAMLAEELSELNAGEGPDFTEEVLAMSANIAGLLKGRPALTETLNKAKTALDDLAKALEVAPEAPAPAPAADPARKAAPDTLSKAVEDRFSAIEKNQQQANELLTEMAKAVAAILGQAAPPAAAANGTAVAVTKAQDAGAPAAEKIDPADPDAALKSVKQSLKNPVPVR